MDTNTCIAFITKINGYVRGHLFRKKFKKNKKIFELANNHEIENLQIQYKFQNLLKAESKRKFIYSQNGWNKFYPEEREKFTKDYGDTLNIRILHINNSEIYSGSVNNENKKHGFGTSIYKNGSKYTGFWEKNIFEGWGEMIDSEANIYQGLFSNGFLNGKGEKFSSNGNHYEGEFLDGLRNGEGIETTKEHVYEGNFENDKKNKKGKLIYKNIKDSYEGNFLDNNITGKGEYKWENGDIFIGDFINGKMHGRGLYKWPDGGEYEGEYINNIKEGNGRFKWSNGKIYEGPFIGGNFYFNYFLRKTTWKRKVDCWKKYF